MSNEFEILHRERELDKLITIDYNAIACSTGGVATQTYVHTRACLTDRNRQVNPRS